MVVFFFCRLVLKCRSKARKQFAALRSDVLVKLELLDNKHFQDMVFQLKRLLGAKYLDFFSSCKTREKYISFAQFVYFLREVCLLFTF